MQKPENLRAKTGDRTLKFLRGSQLCGCIDHWLQCCAGGHYLGRRPHAVRDYRARIFPCALKTYVGTDAISRRFVALHDGKGYACGRARKRNSQDVVGWAVCSAMARRVTRPGWSGYSAC